MNKNKMHKVKAYLKSTLVLPVLDDVFWRHADEMATRVRLRATFLPQMTAVVSLLSTE